MITINIDPIIFTIGPFSLHWYSLIIMSAAAAGLFWGWKAARRAGVSTDAILTVALWGIPGGIIGSRLVHVVDQLDYYLAHPGAIIGGEGQAIYGAVLGGAAAAWLASRRYRLPFAKIADLAAPGLLIAQAIGRVANIINGDAYGKPTSLPWAFVYTHPNTYAPRGVPTHPAPVYEILWDMIVLAIVLKLRGRLRPEGSLFLLYLALYSLGRFLLGFLRENRPFLVPGLNQAQVIALGVLAFSIPWLIMRTRLIRETEAEQGQA